MAGPMVSPLLAALAALLLILAAGALLGLGLYLRRRREHLSRQFRFGRPELLRARGSVPHGTPRRS